MEGAVEQRSEFWGEPGSFQGATGCNNILHKTGQPGVLLADVDESVRKYNGQKLRRRSEVQTKCGALHELLKENATNCQH